MTPYPATHTRYPVLREALREDLARLDDDSLAREIAWAMPGTSADDLEISMRQIGRSLGSAARQVGNVAVRAAPGALTGAMQGATMGAALGPYGMLAGAALGAVGGGLASYSASQQRPQQAPAPAGQPTTQPMQQPAAQPVRQPMAQPVQQPVQQPMAQPIAQPALRPGGTGSAQAIAQLLQVLARPETIQAIMALSAGALGRRQVQVGTQSVTPSELVESIGRVFETAGAASYTGESYGSGDWVLSEMAMTPAEDHPLTQALAAAEAHDPATIYDDAESGYAAFGYNL